MSKVVQIILLSLFQLGVYVLVHELGVRVAPLLFDVSDSGLHWGITVKYSIMVFGIIALVLSIVQALTAKAKNRYLFLIIACVLFCGYYFADLKITPYRTLLVMVSGVLGFTIPLLVKWRYFK